MAIDVDFIPLWLVVAVGTVIGFAVVKYCLSPKDDSLSANGAVIGLRNSTAGSLNRL
jgi:hypothetical protein